MTNRILVMTSSVIMRLLGSMCISYCSWAQSVTPYDPDLLVEIRGIKAFDNHAHPVLYTEFGKPSDRDFDALPVDNMEPSSDPIMVRPDAQIWNQAAVALYGNSGAAAKEKVAREQGIHYPEWVLDQIGVEVMLANRIAMGPSIQPPRFRWVPYADALMFPLDNSGLAKESPDRKLLFPLEDKLRARYLQSLGITRLPDTLPEYLSQVITPILERQKKGGAIAEKFEVAYLRSFGFDKVDATTAATAYKQFAHKPEPPAVAYKQLQDYLFRYIALECGRLGMAVHLHTNAGGGSYFNIQGVNPLLLEPILNDSSLRKTKFVMVHGGWPFIHEISSLLVKPNAYLDFSSQDQTLPPVALAGILREWLQLVPEKVLFGTDAYPASAQMGWEESGWVAARNAREALAIALTAMMRDGEISRPRASQLAHMVLRENARTLYGF